MKENLSNIINFFLLEERVAGMEPEQVVVRGFVSTELHNGSMDGWQMVVVFSMTPL